MGLSARSHKSDDLRKGTKPIDGRAGANRASWSAVLQDMRRQTQQQLMISQSIQTQSYVNNDSIVASLELAIVLLAAVQFELASTSPRWHENRACEQLAGCTTLLPEGPFLLVNVLRAVIVTLSLVRAWYRWQHLRVRVARDDFSRTRINRPRGGAAFSLEVLFTIVVPWPGLENFVPRAYPHALIVLSAAVVVRTVCWRHFLFFPYPIRQHGNVAIFTDSLDFSYQTFVLKKVFDDKPLRKLLLLYALLIVIATYLLRVIESGYDVCNWRRDATTAAADDHDNMQRSAASIMCTRTSWRDALWVVITTCLSTGYGDVLPHSAAGKIAVAVTGAIARVAVTLLFALVIKKNQFRTLEARVHAFLYRMELHAKKDVTAVMAVQATFRFNKSYRQSLIWHQRQDDQSSLYYRPLSTRLPNEVKKKLYVSHFQASLKAILKYNTDGDVLNAFTKHIEVITAALGITFIEVASLKRLYYHQRRSLDDERRRRAKPHSSNSRTLTLAGVAISSSDPSASVGVADTGGSRDAIGGIKALGLAARVQSFASGVAVREGWQSVAHATATSALRTPRTSFQATNWQTEMLRKCDESLALLQRIETTAQSIH